MINPRAQRRREAVTEGEAKNRSEICMTKGTAPTRAVSAQAVCDPVSAMKGGGVAMSGLV